ncbi:MAG: hypothetical protein ACRDK7_01950 [Solirubrobacteraceae bacterium]
MLTERPLLSKQEILRALDPTGRAGDSAFRRLKRGGFITAGIKVKPRRAGRLSGTVTAFCALNRDAATAYRKQRPDLALRLAARAAKLESSRAALGLAEVATRETPNETGELDLDGIYGRVVNGDRRPADDLARGVATARRALAKAMADIGVSTIVGTITRMDSEVVEIHAIDGERYTLPLSALPPGGLVHGSPVSVRVELLGEGAMWTVVEPAWSDAPALEAPKDPFEGLRPRLPGNLDDVLDRVERAHPLALIGPELAWR